MLRAFRGICLICFCIVGVAAIAAILLAAFPKLPEATACHSTGAMPSFICEDGWARRSIDTFLNLPINFVYAPLFVFVPSPFDSRTRFIIFDMILILALTYPFLLLLARKFRTFALGCVLPIAVIVAAFYGAFKVGEYKSEMAFVPADLEVSGILYSNEQNWGSVLLPLPGDNETGIFMYGMPDAIADRIAREGLSFFYRSENVGRRVDMQRTHSEWHETPMGKTISDYLNQYGFGIDVESAVEALIDDALSKPGSFYSYGRLGVVIVIPGVERVIFAYAG
ncbi:hypothetical protein ACQR1W_07685 [Bradyrhizobium sp. HKCCYLS1011]|uniref:hypothetical protein n=1 Tax=Bradyrhizobium sp. HKCCYLS1011 TaxID=3420733 RepID=UPI003EBC4F94